MSASSDLDERRLQFLRATSIGRISEVDFSDRNNDDDDGGETHSDNQSESDAAGGGPLPALYENENEEVERARRPDNNSNTSYKPKALPASLGESRRNIFDTSTRVLRKGSSDNHHALVNTSSTTATNTNYKIDWGDSSTEFNSVTWASTKHTYALGLWNLTYTIEGSNGCSTVKKYIIFVNKLI